MNISATLVLYNENKKTLQNFLLSFSKITAEKELVIIDNSNKPTLKKITEKYKDVIYIFNTKNIGFGAGHNLGFMHLKKHSDIHLIINPDIYFHHKEINDFLLWFIQTKDIALALPKVLNIDGSTQKVVRNIPTPLSLIKRNLGLEDDTIEVNEDCITDIPFAHGCFMAFKRDVYKKLHGFDEQFFLYMEDIDIFIRAKKYGKTVINSKYFIYHEHRRDSKKKIKPLLRHMISAIQFFWKYKNYSKKKRVSNSSMI